MAKMEEINRIQELVYELQAESAMTKDYISVSPDIGMEELRTVLRDNRISGVPVVSKRRLVGIVSIEDFLNWLADDGSNCSISEKMSTDVITVYADEPLVHVVSKLEKHGYGRLPVLDRQTSTLAGIITKGDIIERLLKELEVGYQEEEIRHYRASHFFGDMVADQTTLTFVYEIKNRKIENGGEVASALKKNLRRLGIRPDIVRKAAIAMYEAEMNVIIYAEKARVWVAVGPNIINININDRGPGIPDVEKAKQSGYSTAPEWVRELGFGAGMGLANIEHCCERLIITSKTGRGDKFEDAIYYGERMRLEDIIRELELEIICGKDNLETDVTRGYTSDLMSDVIANAEAGDLWITIQVHVNTIAIASMKDLAAIVLAHGRRPLPETEAKAVEEEIPLLGTSLSAFEIIGRLYANGVTGQ